MKTTENYKLNQWDMTDRIQMEDFNKDNQNIENALTAHDTALAEQAAAIAQKASAADVAAAQTLVKIGEVTLSSASTTLVLSVPNTQNYQQITLYYTVSGVKNMCTIWNGTDVSTLFNLSGNCTSATGCVEYFGPFTSAVFLSHKAYTDYNGSRSSQDFVNYTTSKSYSGTVSIGLQAASGSLASGSRIVLYGLKK